MELFNDRPILLIAGSIALFILGGHFNLLRLVKLAKLIPWFRESRKDGEITPDELVKAFLILWDHASDSDDVDEKEVKLAELLPALRKRRRETPTE
ncbi:MAG: hypothetical protein MK130_08225 [Puniceicoccaceae bacterium]|nr:hypothetical protein [Puniceicoccaceae bacterium]